MSGSGLCHWFFVTLRKSKSFNFRHISTVWLNLVVSEKKEVAAFLRGDLLGWRMGYQGVPRSIRYQKIDFWQ